MIGLIVPSRGRPLNIARLHLSFMETSIGLSRLFVMIDDDDPRELDYAFEASTWRGDCAFLVGSPKRLVAWTNQIAGLYSTQHEVFGSIGDDHVLSAGWERKVLDAVEEMPGKAGVVYGDDGVHGQNLATGFFMTSNIVRTLGYMIPPTLEHLYADNAAMDIGRASTLTYVPDMKIHHLHPIVGKADWDDTYTRGNEGRVQAGDELAYREWKANEYPDVQERLSALVHPG